jgi:hypothetical protein
MMSSHARKVVWGLISAVALIVCAQTGQASALSGSSASLYSGSKLVLGDSASVVDLSIPAAGVLSLTWTDLAFSAQLSSLDLWLSDGTKSLDASQGDGSLTMTFSGPTMLYASIFAAAQGSMDVGLYHVAATFTPAVAAVPLPPLGVWGLGLGFLALLALGCTRMGPQSNLVIRLETIVGAGLLGVLALGWRQGWGPTL